MSVNGFSTIRIPVILGGLDVYRVSTRSSRGDGYVLEWSFLLVYLQFIELEDVWRKMRTGDEKSMDCSPGSPGH